MNLYDTKKGHDYKVKSIRGGRSFINKIESMGILSGTILTRINANVGGGPVVIKVGNSRYALGRGMATKIKVNEIEDA